MVRIDVGEKVRFLRCRVFAEILVCGDERLLARLECCARPGQIDLCHQFFDP